MGSDARRTARVSAKFLVAIEGLDSEYVARVGDVSTSGIYFESDDNDVGGVGTVQWLRLASLDRTRKAGVMACVVRTVALTDASGLRARGVAMEFMPESEESVRELRAFVAYVLAGSSEAVSRVESMIDSSSLMQAKPSRPMSVHTVTLETEWSVTPGSLMRLEIVPPGFGHALRLEGRAARVTKVDDASTPPYRIEIEIESEVEKPVRPRSSTSLVAMTPERIAEEMKRAQAAQPNEPAQEQAISRRLDDLLSALIRPRDRESSRSLREHLAGQLARIPLATLLTLFDMDRLSGILTLHNGAKRVAIFLEDGHVFDVEPAAVPRDAIADALTWREGTFDFVVQEIERADRFGVSTSALLLDLARVEDEAKHAENEGGFF